MLVDSFGRTHDNLRVSVTDRCNLRCVYCMPDGEPTYLPKAELLTFEEIERFVRIAVGLGVHKVRITGGEPLVRRDVHLLVRMLAGIDGIQDLALTTNGLLLAEQARALHDAGLRRINVHLDTLDPAKFQRLVRRPGLERVLAGLDAAQAAGFDRIKINAVAIRGETEEDLVPLARLGRERGFEVRFIEYMPLDAGNHWERKKVLFGQEIVDTLSREIAPLIPEGRDVAGAPATEFRFSDGVGRIGLIASVSQPFCRSCNRIRLTADGQLRYCLFAREESDVRSLFRGGAADEAVADLVRRAVAGKWEGHEINAARFLKPQRPMYAIGG
ncbi:MAG TPA: GTP 3',8-cyclase MoaA [Myxococcaceae bacterium]|nr:GTP 3',8-cyclase MoaA [Myxococcaceae bacterium]